MVVPGSIGRVPPRGVMPPVDENHHQRAIAIRATRCSNAVSNRPLLPGIYERAIIIELDYCKVECLIVFRSILTPEGYFFQMLSAGDPLATHGEHCARGEQRRLTATNEIAPSHVALPGRSAIECTHLCCGEYGRLIPYCE